MLANYVVLADAWRRILEGWGRSIGLRPALRIWLISSLGRYVPGKVWQMGTMAVLAKREGLSGIGAAGAALTITVLNTLVGFAVVAIFGLQLLQLETLGIIAIAVIALGVLIAPRLLPWAAARAGRLTGREVTVPALPHRVLWYGIAISALTWITYGVAFYLLAVSVLDDPAGGVPAYVAIYTFSYLLGFLALFAPGGIVVREVALAAALVNMGMPEGSAIVLAVVSRLWLTILEITPAVVLLAWDQMRRRTRNAAHQSPL